MPKKKITKKKSTRKVTKKKTIRRRNPEKELKESVDEIQELMNEEYDIDLRELAKSAYAEDDDIIVASYWIASDWHSGQFSPLYKVLSYYKPGRMKDSVKDEDETVQMLYELIEEEIQAIEKRRAKARKNPKKKKLTRIKKNPKNKKEILSSLSPRIRSAIEKLSYGDRIYIHDVPYSVDIAKIIKEIPGIYAWEYNDGLYIEKTSGSGAGDRMMTKRKMLDSPFD